MEEIYNKKQNRKTTKQGVVLLRIIAIIVFFSINACSSENMENITLKLSSSQIIILNESSETYKNVTVLINDKYKAKFNELPSNGMYAIGFMLFSDKDGNRYNMSMKTHKVYISAQNSKEKSATAIFQLD